MLPFVFEKGLNAFFQINFYRLHFVEFLDCTEEFCQVVSIVKIWVKWLECDQYLRKVAHNDWKDGNSKK